MIGPQIFNLVILMQKKMTLTMLMLHLEVKELILMTVVALVAALYIQILS